MRNDDEIEIIDEDLPLEDEEISNDEFQKQLLNFTTFESRIARADSSEDPLKEYEEIYALLRISCGEAAKSVSIIAGKEESTVSDEKIKKVNEIIAYLDKNKDGLEGLKTAVSVLNSTEKLLLGPMHMTPEAYKAEALKLKQTGHKILGAFMMVLGSIMVAVGIGLSATGVATGAGISMVIGGGALAGTGHRFFEAGKKGDELHQDMTDLADFFKKTDIYIDSL